MSDVNTWSTTAASNNSAVPNGWPDTMASSGINNSAREMMAAIAKWYGDKNGSLVTTGSASTYALSPNRTFTAYGAGMDFVIRVNAASTGNTTINVSTLGAKDIRDEAGNQLAPGALQTAAMYHISYDATNGYFRLVGNPMVIDQTLATNGHVTLPSGFKINWGEETVAANTTDTVTFESAFTSTMYVVTPTIKSTSTTDYYPFYANPIGASTFSLTNPNSTQLTAYWLAMGY